MKCSRKLYQIQKRRLRNDINELYGRPTKNGIDVSAVYNPTHLRKKGYASAFVAHSSQLMLNNGKSFYILYTDLSNPTSNKIYQQNGYKEVARSSQYVFGE